MLKLQNFQERHHQLTKFHIVHLQRLKIARNARLMTKNVHRLFRFALEADHTVAFRAFRQIVWDLFASYAFQKGDCLLHCFVRLP